MCICRGIPCGGKESTDIFNSGDVLGRISIEQDLPKGFKENIFKHRMEQTRLVVNPTREKIEEDQVRDRIYRRGIWATLGGYMYNYRPDIYHIH